MKNVTKVLVASTIAGLVGLSGFMLPASANTSAKNTTAPAQTIAQKPAASPSTKTQTTSTMKKTTTTSTTTKPKPTPKPSASPAMKKSP